jgi:6-phosphogluconolactonase
MNSQAVVARKLAVCGIAGWLLLAGCGGGGNSRGSSNATNSTTALSLERLDPHCAPAGAPTIDLHVIGQGFVAGSIVRWNGNERPTTFGSKSGLIANITASDLAAAGSAVVTVINPGAGGVNSNSVAFTISTGGVAPQSIAVDPGGKFAYVTVAGCNGQQAYIAGPEVYVSRYTINPATGMLSAIEPQALAADVGTNFVTVAPSGKFAYVASNGEGEGLGIGTVTAYSIDQTTGALKSTSSTYSPCTSGGTEFCPLWSLAVDPSGRFAYVGGADGLSPGNVSTYAIDANTGRLALADTVANKGRASSVAAESSGKFVYAINADSNKVSTYSLNPNAATLAYVGTIATGSNPTALIIHPSGQYAYVTNSGASGDPASVSMYAIDATSGALASIGTIATGANPAAIIIHPSGKYVYVLNRDSNTVSMYAVNAATGALASIGRIVTGADPTAIAIHPSGKYVYVTNSESNDVWMYAIDATTGTLTLIGTVGT